jgi:uncharacterized protein YutE (UPF0331/DUF86 family)
MTVDADLVAARVAKIREQLHHLARLSALERTAFLASPIEQHAAERELAVAIEACLDIGHHVIAREGFRRPGDYRDVFRILREQEIIAPDLGHRLEDMGRAFGIGSSTAMSTSILAAFTTSLDTSCGTSRRLLLPSSHATSSTPRSWRS